MKRKVEDVVESDPTIKKSKSDFLAVEQIKILKQQLRDETTVINALEDFLKNLSYEEEENPEFLKEYLRMTPDCNELFSPLIADKTSARKLINLWNIIEKIFNTLSADWNEHEENEEHQLVYLPTAGYKIVCNILQNHLNIVYSSIANNVKPKVRTSVLKCMASMLSQGTGCVKEFLKYFEFSACYKHFKDAAKVSKKQKHEEDARSCFVRFYLAFLVFGDVAAIKKLLEQKDFSALLMAELHLDKLENISIILETIDDKIVHEANLLKTSKLAFFSQHVLLKLIFLVKNNNENIRDIATKIVMTLCTNQKYGICFHMNKDEPFTGKLVNPVLLKFLTSIKQSAIMREEIRVLSIDTLVTCPDIIIPYVNSLSLSLDPRLSDFWCTKIVFLTKLWEGIPKIKDLYKTSLRNQQKDTVMKLVIPSIITRQLFTNGMKSKLNKVKETTLQLLEVTLTRCVDLIEKLKQDNDLNVVPMLNQWIDTIICILPDMTPIIGIRQMSAQFSDKDVKPRDGGESESGSVSDPLEMEILLDQSVKCLNLCQKIKPGILTLSGYNICKLLLFSRNVTEDVLLGSLQILLAEPQSGVTTWLKKKLSGSENVFHILLKIMFKWDKSEEIIQCSKKMFFNILNNMGQFFNYAFEVESWITHFLFSLNSSSADKASILIEEFANACINTVNKPFMYLENISSVFEEQKSNSTNTKGEFKLPSPLFFAVLRNMASESVIKSMIIPVMTELIITNDSPDMLLRVLVPEIPEDCIHFYQELLCFSYEWLFGLGLNVDFMNQYMEHKAENDNASHSTVLINIAILLLKLKENPEKSITMICSMKDELKMYCSKSTSASYSAILTFISSIVQFAHRSVENPEHYHQLLDILTTTLKILLYQKIDLECLTSFANKLFYLPAFTDLPTNSRVWQHFTLDIATLLTENCNELKSAPSLEQFVDKFVTIIFANGISEIDRCELIQRFSKFAINLESRKLSEYAENFAISLFTCEEVDFTNERMKNVSLWFDKFREIGLGQFSCSKLQSKDLNLFLHKCIASGKSRMLKLFGEVISLLQYDGEVVLRMDDFEKLLIADKLLIQDTVFMSRRNIKIVKSDDSNDLVFFNEEFIQRIMENRIKISDLINNLLSLLINVLRNSSQNEEIGKKIKSLLFPLILKQDFSSDVVKLVTICLQWTSLDEKLECLEKIQIALKFNSDKESIMILCRKLFTMIEDGKKEKFCLIESITSIMGHISDLKQDDLSFKPCLENLLHLIQILSTYETKLKSERYKALGVGWIKFVKKILKSKYDNFHAMNILLDCIAVLYTNKQFVKSCPLQAKDLYQFVVSHSKFLQTMSSEEKTVADQKLVLIKLISKLIELAEVYTTAMVPVFLAAYETNLSEKDHYLLTILQNYEQNGVSLAKFYPFVWGSHAFDVYKEKELNDTLYSEQPSAQVLENIEKDKMVKSAIEFPVMLKSEGFNEVTFPENYDPKFYMPLFLTLLQPERSVDCFHFIESGCLSFVLAATSSFDLSKRKIAYSILSLYNDHLDSASFREKSQMTYLMMLLKNSVSEEFVRLPSVWVSYFIQYIKYVLKADHHLYTVLNIVALQKAVINVKELPVFFNLFNSSNVEHATERGWILNLLVTGIKDVTDYYLYKKYHVFEILLAFYDSQICDKNMKNMIDNIFVAACSSSTATFDLVKTNSILSWIHCNVMKHTNGTDLSNIVNLIHVISKAFQSNENDIMIPKLLLHELNLICEHILQLNNLKTEDSVKICSVYSWVLSSENQFGEMVKWQNKETKIQFINILTKLMFEVESDYDKRKCSRTFCDIVVAQLETDIELLENIEWHKLKSLTKNESMKNLSKLFDKLINHCHIKNKSKLLHKVVNVM